MHLPIETEHLHIRPFRAEDAEVLYQIHLQPEVKQWFPNESYADLAETQGAIAFFSDCVTNGHLPYVLAIELKATGELLGDTGVSEVDGAPDELEIGYVITRAHAGKGYATEACRAIALFCTEAFKAKVLWGRVVKGNAASSRVLGKAGYTFLREETGAEDDPYGNGMLVYRLNL